MTFKDEHASKAPRLDAPSESEASADDANLEAGGTSSVADDATTDTSSATLSEDLAGSTDAGGGDDAVRDDAVSEDADGADSADDASEDDASEDDADSADPIDAIDAVEDVLGADMDGLSADIADEIPEALWSDMMDGAGGAAAFDGSPAQAAAPQNTTPPGQSPWSTPAPKREAVRHARLEHHTRGLNVVLLNEAEDAEATQHIAWGTLSETLREGMELVLRAQGEQPDPDGLRQLGQALFELLTEGTQDAMAELHRSAHPETVLKMTLGPALAEGASDVAEVSEPEASTTGFMTVPQDVVEGPRDAQINPTTRVLLELEEAADEAIVLGQRRRALQLVQTALTRYRTTQDPLGVARCLIRGAELLMEGDRFHKRALEWLQQAYEAHTQERDVPTEHALRNDTWRLRAAFGLARLDAIQGEWEAAQDACLRALDDAGEASLGMVGRLMILMARACAAVEDRDQARQWLQEAIQTLRPSKEPELLAQAHRALGELLLSEGDLLGTHAHLAAALRLAYELGDVEHVVDLSEVLAQLSEDTGELELAWDYACRALPYLDELEDDGEQLPLRFLMRLLRIGPGVVEPTVLTPFFEHASELLPALEPTLAQAQLITLLLQAGHAPGLESNLPSLMPHLERILDAHEGIEYQDGTPSREALLELGRMCASVGQWLETKRDFALGRDMYKGAVRTFEQLDELSFKVEAECGMGRCETGLGAYTSADAIFASALQQARVLGDARLMLNVHLGQARLSNLRGDLKQTGVILRQMLPLHEQRGNTMAVAITLIQLADLELDRAEQAMDEATQGVPERAFDPNLRGSLLLASETLRKSLGDANRHLNRVRDLLGDGAKQHGFYLACLGHANLLYGDNEDAFKTLEVALAATPTQSEPYISVCIACWLAEALWFLGRPDDARSSLEFAQELARTVGGEPEGAMVTRYQGRLAFLRGDHNQAIEHLTRAMAAAEMLESRRLVQTMQLELSLQSALMRRYSSRG